MISPALAALFARSGDRDPLNIRVGAAIESPITIQTAHTWRTYQQHLNVTTRAVVAGQGSTDQFLSLAGYGICPNPDGADVPVLTPIYTPTLYDSLGEPIAGSVAKGDDIRTIDTSPGNSITLGIVSRQNRRLPFMADVYMGAGMAAKQDYGTYPFTNAQGQVKTSPTGKRDGIVNDPRLSVLVLPTGPLAYVDTTKDITTPATFWTYDPTKAADKAPLSLAYDRPFVSKNGLLTFQTNPDDTNGVRTGDKSGLKAVGTYNPDGTLNGGASVSLAATNPGLLLTGPGGDGLQVDYAAVAAATGGGGGSAGSTDINVTISASLGFTTNSRTVLPWNTELFKHGITHSTTTNPSQLIAPVAGRYAVGCSVDCGIPVNGTGIPTLPIAEAFVSVTVNGAVHQGDAFDTDDRSGTVSDIVELNPRTHLLIDLLAGDVVEFWLTPQSSAPNGSTSVRSNSATYAYMFAIGGGGSSTTPIAARATNGAITAQANGSAVPWMTTDYDRGAPTTFLSGGTPTRFTMPAPGYARACCTSRIRVEGAVGDDEFISLDLVKNGSTIASDVWEGTPSATNTSAHQPMRINELIGPLAAGDFIEFSVEHQINGSPHAWSGAGSAYVELV